jgi:hypothetical protein
LVAAPTLRLADSPALLDAAKFGQPRSDRSIRYTVALTSPKPPEELPMVDGTLVIVKEMSPNRDLAVDMRD